MPRRRAHARSGSRVFFARHRGARARFFQPLWDTAGCGYGDAFLAGLGALDDANLGLRYAELSRQELDQLTIRLTVHGRGRNPNLEAYVAKSDHFVAACARLHLQLEYQRTPVPAPWPRAHNMFRAVSIIGAMKSRSTSFKATITTMGDRSSPPIGGITRRAGPSSGSVRL